MKNIPLLISRVLLLTIIAAIVSSLIGFILMFIFGNLDTLDQNIDNINMVTYLIFGTMFGYKLNDIIQESRK